MIGPTPKAQQKTVTRNYNLNRLITHIFSHTFDYDGGELHPNFLPEKSPRPDCHQKKKKAPLLTATTTLNHRLYHTHPILLFPPLISSSLFISASQSLTCCFHSHFFPPALIVISHINLIFLILINSKVVNESLSSD
jgi:hypothetical protein